MTSLDTANPPRALVEPPEQRAVVDDIPDAVAHLLKGDVLAAEYLTEEVRAGVQGETAERADATHFGVRGEQGGRMRSG